LSYSLSESESFSSANNAGGSYSPFYVFPYICSLKVSTFIGGFASLASLVIGALL
jgi:hypothetical protein